MAELDSSPFQDDLREELAAQPRRGVSRLTVGLAAGVVLVAGILIGIQAGRLSGSPSAASAPSGLSGTFAGQRQPGAGGLPGGYGQRGAAQGGGGTMGTVEKVEDGKVYVLTTDGSTVTVTTTGETAVRVTAPGEVSDLKPGSTVVVRGQRGQDGTVAASSITEGGGFGR
ncbi:hypothetical protein [Nonomuraea pusilla]|uniref:DUF5666 domain-containing protein n=1 Tax=Nonomuraea pusilla TaxID=46177 RepID=A0A1H7XNZ7_9ACTN|nr:hypothetical protein [Nonomuraea pusilla]SEM35353.1 hypothetical protein SAMN05660976_04899 [Nonomuraea pusilla]